MSKNNDGSRSQQTTKVARQHHPRQAEVATKSTEDEVWPGSEAMIQATTNPRLASPTTLIALQRTVGNQAIQRMVTAADQRHAVPTYTPTTILSLQRTQGNQFVQRLLQRQSEEEEATEETEAPETLAPDLDEVLMSEPDEGAIQLKREPGASPAPIQRTPVIQRGFKEWFTKSRTAREYMQDAVDPTGLYSGDARQSTAGKVGQGFANIPGVNTVLGAGQGLGAGALMGTRLGFTPMQKMWEKIEGLDDDTTLAKTGKWAARIGGGLASIAYTPIGLLGTALGAGVGGVGGALEGTLLGTARGARAITPDGLKQWTEGEDDGHGGRRARDANETAEAIIDPTGLYSGPDRQSGGGKFGQGLANIPGVSTVLGGVQGMASGAMMGATGTYRGITANGRTGTGWKMLGAGLGLVGGALGAVAGGVGGAVVGTARGIGRGARAIGEGFKSKFPGVVKWAGGVWDGIRHPYNKWGSREKARASESARDAYDPGANQGVAYEDSPQGKFDKYRDHDPDRMMTAGQKVAATLLGPAVGMVGGAAEGASSTYNAITNNGTRGLGYKVLGVGAGLLGGLAGGVAGLFGGLGTGTLRGMGRGIKNLFGGKAETTITSPARSVLDTTARTGLYIGGQVFGPRGSAPTSATHPDPTLLQEANTQYNDKTELAGKLGAPMSVMDAGVGALRVVGSIAKLRRAYRERKQAKKLNKMASKQLASVKEKGALKAVFTNTLGTAGSTAGAIGNIAKATGKAAVDTAGQASSSLASTAGTVAGGFFIGASAIDFLRNGYGMVRAAIKSHRLGNIAKTNGIDGTTQQIAEYAHDKKKSSAILKAVGMLGAGLGIAAGAAALAGLSATPVGWGLIGAALAVGAGVGLYKFIKGAIKKHKRLKTIRADRNTLDNKNRGAGWMFKQMFVWDSAGRRGKKTDERKLAAMVQDRQDNHNDLRQPDAIAADIKANDPVYKAYQERHKTKKARMASKLVDRLAAGDPEAIKIGKTLGVLDKNGNVQQTKWFGLKNKSANKNEPLATTINTDRSGLEELFKRKLVGT